MLAAFKLPRELDGNVLHISVSTVSLVDLALIRRCSTVRPHCDNFCPMSAVLSPIVSEFETKEQEASYNQ